MKRLLGIAATAGLLAAAPAFAGVDVVVQFGMLAPVYTVPAPVYVAPAAYYRHDRRWSERHHHFDRHFRDHRWHHDYRHRR